MDAGGRATQEQLPRTRSFIFLRVLGNCSCVAYMDRYLLLQYLHSPHPCGLCRYLAGAEAAPRQPLPALLYLLHPCSRKAPTVGAKPQGCGECRKRRSGFLPTSCIRTVVRAFVVSFLNFLTHQFSSLVQTDTRTHKIDASPTETRTTLPYPMPSITAYFC
jgi:hypothetical protein